MGGTRRVVKVRVAVLGLLQGGTDSAIGSMINV